jgi:hypothetical protein
MNCHGNVKSGRRKKTGCKEDYNIGFADGHPGRVSWSFYINTPKWQKVTLGLKIFFNLMQGND